MLRHLLPCRPESDRSASLNWTPDATGIFLGDQLGECDVGIETACYDAALHMAGIENYNVML
jgi:hypothetical protein